ncbi:MAG: 4'-phosphopantetheinyl transferase [Planctomycetota bacterium]|jgi:4'-phosphopantetheinyl transferase
MPLILDIVKPHFQLKAWHITEDVSFFEEKVSLYESEKEILNKIQRDTRKLQWLSARYILKELTNNEEVIKNKHGKPFLKSKNGYISISHCQNFAVAIYSKELNVGIDIEPQREKVIRIADKFLSENELSCIEKEQEVKHLITSWAMKEAAFKWYGREYISFKHSIQIAPYKYNDKLSRIRVNVVSPKKTYKLRAFHINLQEHSMVFCFGKKDLENLFL